MSVYEYQQLVLYALVAVIALLAIIAVLSVIILSNVRAVKQRLYYLSSMHRKDTD